MMRLILILLCRAHLTLANWHDKQADKYAGRARARKRPV